ncbi:MAG: 16S rRNA (cytosine(1402)-N(4))-methyltransferase RsmH [Lentisphaeria bacterium]
MSFQHEPVLVTPVLELLQPRPGGHYLDGTVGGGGHAAALLAAAPGAWLLGLDQDDAALAAAATRLAPWGDRVVLQRCRYSGMAAAVRQLDWERLDGILLDIGVSSHQIDTPERGFAHRHDGPLDMRMDRRRPLTASGLLNHSSEEELARIFREYGEEPRARALARAVAARRQAQPWERTGEFAELAAAVCGGHQRSLPAATRAFQALRIAVNDELGELERGLRAAHDLLAPGGRLAVICFHSLEDRLVKNFFRDAAATCVCPPGLPECRCGKVSTLRVVTRKPVFATATERAANPRSAPARLRVAERLP